MSAFGQYIVAGVTVGSIYALIAVGLVLIYKASGIFNFAQAGLLVMGAFIAWTFLDQLGLPLPLAMLCLLLTIGVLGFLIQRLALQRLIGESTIASVIVTLCLLILLRGAAILIWGGAQRHYPEGSMPLGAAQLGGVIIPWLTVLCLGVALLFVLLFWLYFRYSKIGLEMRVVAEGHQIARSLGLSVPRVLIYAWVISSVVAGVAGLLTGGMLGVGLHLEEIGLKAFAVVLLGGLESINGAIVAGLIIGILEGLCAGYLTTYLPGAVADVAPFVILLVILVIRPQGIFGQEIIERI